MGRGDGVIYMRVRAALCSMKMTYKVPCADGVEQIWCGVKSDSESVLVGCMYRLTRIGSNVTEGLNKSLV